MPSAWSVRIGRDDPLHLRQLFTLGPSRDDHWIGLRCGVGVLLPLATLLLLGRIDVAVFVIFGAFTNVFGRVPNHLDRLLAQLKAGGTFWVLMVAGTVVSGVLPHGTTPGLAAKLALTSVVAGGAALWAAWQEIRPAGSLFHVFAFAAIVSTPPTAPLGDGMFAATATIGLALVLGQLGRLWPQRRTPRVATPVRVLDAAGRRAALLEAGIHLLAAFVAGLLIIPIAQALHLSHYYWAMVAAVVPLVGHSTRERVARGVHRVLGTFGGLLILALMVWWQPPLWVVVVVMGLCQFGAEMFIARNYFIGQSFVTPLALLGTSIAGGLGFDLFRDRVIETAVGSAVGIGAVITITLIRRRLAQVREADPEVEES